MKDGWERTEAPNWLDRREIDTLVASVWSGSAVLDAKRLGEGFSNANYKLRLEGSGGPVVLRLYRGAGEIAEKELAISRLVGGDVPVPSIFHADRSLKLLDRPWALMEWKDGELLKNVMRSGDPGAAGAAAEQAGAALARIHGYTFPEAGFFGEDLTVRQPFRIDADSFLAFMEDSLFARRSGRWLGAELTERLWGLCRKHAPLLTEEKEEAVLVHSDFNGLNVLVGGPPDRAVAAVLDWEFAFAGSRLVDIANMLRYEEAGSPFERHFVSGYIRSGGRLPTGWRRLAKLEDLIALCDLLNRSAEDAPSRIADLKRLIAGTARELAD